MAELDTPKAETTETATLRGPGYTLALVTHLIGREIAQTNRFSAIGAAWPLLRQLAQLTVLVVAFGTILDLGIPDYPVFVFCGLIGWTWFVAGLSTAATSIRANRALAMRAGFPTPVLPVVATAVPLVDVLFALPVLLVMLLFTAELSLTVPLLIPLLVLQGAMGVGLGWIAASLSVYFRDIPQLVNVVLLMGFYLTPVYFDVGRVPEDYQWLLRLNPMAVLLEADRAVLLGTPFPPWPALAGVVVFTGLVLGGGWMLFSRLRAGFVDEL